MVLSSRGTPVEASTGPTQHHRPLTVPAALFALLLAILWSGLPIATKVGLDYAPPLLLSAMRFVVGGVVVLFWALATKTDLRLRPGEWKPLAVLGALFSVQIAFLNNGLNLTTAGHNGILTVTFSIWVAVLAHFFVPGDRLTVPKLLGVLIAYGGIVVLFADSLGVNTNVLLGDIFSAISGFLLGARLVYNSRIVQNLHSAKLLLAQAVCGTTAFVVASLLFEDVPVQWTARLAASVFYQGVIVAGFCFIGSLWLLKRYFPSQVSVISLSQPLFSIVAAWFILGEPLSSTLWLSAALVVVGAWLVRRRPQPASEPA
ncbi:MAG: hypothetical protein CL878_07705 [Dehalococcoidia bacterium]|nr:hypothetical protein [Dehalococcoidia bacterium]